MASTLTYSSASHGSHLFLTWTSVDRTVSGKCLFRPSRKISLIVLSCFYDNGIIRLRTGDWGLNSMLWGWVGAVKDIAAR